MAETFALTRGAIELDPRTARSRAVATGKTFEEVFHPEAHAKAKAALAKHMTKIGFKSQKMLPETM